MAGESVRYLSRADVEAVGPAGTEVIEILDAVFRAKRAGAVEMPPKIGVHPREDAFIHAMPAYLSDADAVGLKWVAGYPGNQRLGLPYIHGLFVLSDAPTGRPLAVMDATWITEVRTAAASMLGIRALAEGPVETIGIIGCGRQGHVHLELAGQVFPRSGARPCSTAIGSARRRWRRRTRRSRSRLRRRLSRWRTART
jgi:ornithine cyclodeaminase/alanine dehydrogenase-like protein (mu-crystallin family)